MKDRVWTGIRSFAYTTHTHTQIKDINVRLKKFKIISKPLKVDEYII